MRLRLLILFFILYCSGVFSQTAKNRLEPDSVSSRMLKQAENYYNTGQFIECLDEVEKLLSKYELKKSDKVRALETGAKAAVETGQNDLADSYLNVMLKVFPHYDLKEEDNPEMFNRLVKKYTIHPALTIGIRNTADWINYRTMSVFAKDGLSYDAPYFKRLQGILQGFGFMYYGWGEIQFDRDIALNGDLIFKWTSNNRELTQGSPYELSSWEQDNFMEIPVYIKKYFHPWKNVLTYAAAGVGWLYLTEAKGNFTIYYPANDSISSTGTMNLLPFRNRSTTEWLVGTGIGYRYRNLRMFFEARLYGGFSSITNPEKTAADPVLYNEYRYLDNKVRLTQFEMGAAISYTLFNSVKKKQKR